MSSERRFEHIENKIKEAAENNEIVFEENSWKKMEALLDKEDKRKPFVWLWFLLPIALLGSYGLFVFSESTNNAAHNNLTQNNIEKSSPNAIIPTQETHIGESLKADEKNINTIAPTNIVATLQTNNVATNNFYSTSKNSGTEKELSNENYTSSFSNKKNTLKTKNDNNEVINDKAINDVAQNKNSIRKSSKTKINIRAAEITEDEAELEKKNNLQKEKIAVQEKIINPETASKKETTPAIAKNSTAKSEKKKESKILSRFYLLAAAGSDIGSVKLFSFKNNSLVAKYGFAIGYNFNKKLSMQAGFYSSKKKYIASTADYNIKAGTYWTTIPITKIDAVCLIYELPISLQYNFLQRKSFNVYAGAGVSSYFMKTENYNYFYKRYNMNLTKEYNYTGNQHLFSTALLSVGIEKNISNKFALRLEPTVSIPLKGVGEGAVKLFSTSLLLGIKYHPFKK
jgi:hypothetical protein